MNVSLTMANRSKLYIKKISKSFSIGSMLMVGKSVIFKGYHRYRYFQMTPGHHLNLNTCLLTGCDVDPLLKEKSIVVPLLDPRACFSPNFPGTACSYVIRLLWCGEPGLMLSSSPLSTGMSCGAVSQA